jgi:hypothetical protein
MHPLETTEGLLLNELRGVCIDCANAGHCSYREATDKIIIQCEMHQLVHEVETFASDKAPRGLCINCCKVTSCKLPGRSTVIWHCEEYE